MSKPLKNFVKDIQYQTDKTLDEIAGDAGYSPAYFRNEVSKGTNKAILEKLKGIYPNIEQNVPRGNMEGSSVAGSTVKGTLTKAKIPDAIQYLSEKVTLIEAGMEVERSMLIDLLAQATGRSTMEISTEVAKALDYQISKRLDEAKKQYT